jgi:hypothetical protein
MRFSAGVLFELETAIGQLDHDRKFDRDLSIGRRLSIGPRLREYT